MTGMARWLLLRIVRDLEAVTVHVVASLIDTTVRVRDWLILFASVYSQWISSYHRVCVHIPASCLDRRLWGL